ncbi:dethiobiotin synthase [Aminipila sp.]|uniref:dethiobiotin synthase n=1 Tax=Aminipila sp. TaxID=2060095 RepID=UPI0028997A20|nr:dethiobiotin synthase [Aminipila sp.]
METNIFNNKKGIFITGTGTDIGKTYVSGLIVKVLRDKHINAGYYKPALSGAYMRNGKLIPGDAEYVCEISGLTEPYENLVSYMFETAVSPHLASQMESDCEIDRNVIWEDYNKLSQKYDFMVVEGCGGILCPLNTPKSLSPVINHDKSNLLLLPDIIKLLNLDIIIVADAGLGTINLVLLTVEYAKQSHIGIAGIILNHFEEHNFLHQDNKKQIEFLTALPVLACIPTKAEI